MTLRQIGNIFSLFNPVFLIAMLWAAIRVIQHERHRPLPVFLFSMGVPLFLCGVLLSFRSSMPPDWIAPAVIPLFCLMTWYWARQSGPNLRRARPWFAGGLAMGIFAVVILHDTRLLGGFFGLHLPAASDPLVPLRGWTTVALLTEEARQSLETGREPVFIITDNLRSAGLLTFYLAEGRSDPGQLPLICDLDSTKPNQLSAFHYEQQARKGEDALFVRIINIGQEGKRPLPVQLTEAFESVTPIGLKDVTDNRRKIRTLEFHACRNLR